LSPPVSAIAAHPLRSASGQDDQTLTLAFDDNRLLPHVFGEHDEHLALLEHRLSVAITPKGNRVAIRGGATAAEDARTVLLSLYARASRGSEVTRGDVDGAIRMIRARDEGQNENAVRTRRKSVNARNLH
jgi:phosphate starvation-inducible protein PhoH and related proteins